MTSLTPSLLGRFLENQSGATAIEYTLIAAGIAAAVIATVFSLGTEVNVMWQKVADIFPTT